MLQGRPSVSTEDLLRLWELEMEVRRLSSKTVRERLRFVRHIDRALGPAAELDEGEVRDFLADCAKTKAATTQFNYHTILRMWFGWLVERAHREDDPTLPFGKPRLPRMAPRPAETQHLHSVINHGNLQPQTHMKVLLAALQGMRTIEIARVRGEDVDFVAMRLRIIRAPDIAH